jgi:hypothetical protein
MCESYDYLCDIAVKMKSMGLDPTAKPIINENAYVGVNNSFQEHWIPYMTSIGYKSVSQTSFKGEADVFWEII